MLDLITEAISDNPDYADEFLKDRGVDLEGSSKANYKFFNKLKVQHEMKEAERQLEAKDRASESFRQSISKKLETLSMSPTTFLAMMQERQMLNMSFSKAESLDDDDAIDIIQEAGLEQELDRLIAESS